jgi:hypothetical protein
MAEFPDQPSEHVRLHGVGRHRNRVHVIALAALERSDIVALRAGRDPRQVHPDLTALPAAGMLDYRKRGGCRARLGIRHGKARGGLGGSVTELSVTDECRGRFGDGEA